MQWPHSGDSKMTTIVVDRKMGYMAADRMTTANDGGVAGEGPKIVTFNDGLITYAGHEGSGQLFLNWYTKGDWDEPLVTMENTEIEDDFTAVILTNDYEIWLADKFMVPWLWHSRWYAAGSGGSHAWAVLKAGCNIDKAMNVALDMDPNSGYGYDIEYLKDSTFGGT